jgi:hypothetical protein
MEAMLRISLYNFLNSTSKNALSFLLCLCLLFNKIRVKDRTDSAWKRGGLGGEMGVGSRGEK